MSANSVSAGGGGSINLAYNSADLFTVGSGSVPLNGIENSISAAGGVDGGNGGSIIIQNHGSGSATVTSGANLDVAPGNGNGGIIGISVLSGTLTFTSGSQPLSASANVVAFGNFSGGQIVLQSSVLTIQGPPLSLLANGVGAGNGGSVSVSATTSSISVGLSGQLVVSATGGSSGSLSGNGGSVSLNAGQNLTVDMSSVTIAPQGNNGNGFPLPADCRLQCRRQRGGHRRN